MIQLQIYFKVAESRTSELENVYTGVYIPALRKQQGYLGSRLLRLFPPAAAAAIGASPTEFNYQMELEFDTEENRMKWVASPEHVEAWPMAEAVCEAAAWRGYDVAGKDE